MAKAAEQTGSELLRSLLEDLDVEQVLRRLKNRGQGKRADETSSLDMQDILQEALLHALQKGAGFTGATQDDAVRWVIGIAQNKGREAVRQRSQRGSCWEHGLVDVSSVELEGLAARESPVEARLDAMETLERLKQALHGCLSKIDRLLVLVHNLDEVPLREIAERAGVSASQVSRKHAEAMRKLARELGMRRRSDTRRKRCCGAPWSKRESCSSTTARWIPGRWTAGAFW